MIYKLDLGKEHVVAFRVDGRVDVQDMKASQQAILPELKSNARFNLYLELTDEAEIEPEAIAERVRFLFSNFGEIKDNVNKLALVTDKNWLQQLASGIYKLVPAIEQRSFAFEEAEEARKWIAD
jgi:hypothetical protein